MVKFVCVQRWCIIHGRMMPLQTLHELATVLRRDIDSSERVDLTISRYVQKCKNILFVKDDTVFKNNLGDTALFVVCFICCLLIHGMCYDKDWQGKIVITGG